MSKFNFSFFFFKKKLILDSALRCRGSFIFFNFFLKKITVSASLNDKIVNNISKLDYILKKFLKQKRKIHYIFADKRGSVKIFNLKVNLNKKFFGYFLFNFFFFFFPILDKNGLNFKISSYNLVNFNFFLTDFFFFKDILKLKYNFSNFFFKILLSFNFLKYRAIFFNLKKFFKNILVWNFF